MSCLSSIFALTVLLVPFSAANCDIGQGACLEIQEDETSLVQIKQTVKFGDERQESSEASEVREETQSLIDETKALMEKMASEIPKETKSLIEVGADSSSRESSDSNKKDHQIPGMTAIVLPQQQVSKLLAETQPAASNLLSTGAVQVPMAALAGAGYMGGIAPTPTDYHYNSMTVQTQVSPGGGNEDPRRAAARAAEAEERAERAMENAVWKAQQEERAAMFASKRAAALRAAAEKAASAENQAARSQIAAADALEASAVRQAATDRSHARVAAYKSIVQQATAYQAAADQTFAAQRAAAARAAAQTAQRGLHTMQEDTEGSDYQFNDRDARRSQRHRYHNAMDSINYDRQRFRGMDEDEDYDTDEDEDYRGHRFYPPHVGDYPRGPVGAAMRGAAASGFRHGAAAGAAACAMGDMVSATYAGDGRQYQAKVAGINPDSTITVTWLDGFAEGNIIPAAQVYKGSMPCGGGAGAAPMQQPMLAGGVNMAAAGGGYGGMFD